MERLISLELVETGRNALALTAHGERLVADLPTGRLDSLSLDDDPHVVAVAKALGVKL